MIKNNKCSFFFSKTIHRFDSSQKQQKLTVFFAARATDPFTAEIDRVKYVDQLCKGICKEVDGPKNAFRLLAYKVLSPSQTEVLNTLKVTILTV